MGTVEPVKTEAGLAYRTGKGGREIRFCSVGGFGEQVHSRPPASASSLPELDKSAIRENAASTVTS